MARKQLRFVMTARMKSARRRTDSRYIKKNAGSSLPRVPRKDPNQSVMCHRRPQQRRLKHQLHVLPNNQPSAKIQLDHQIARLFYACNLPFNITSHPELKKTIEMLRPCGISHFWAYLPGREIPVFPSQPWC